LFTIEISFYPLQPWSAQAGSWLFAIYLTLEPCFQGLRLDMNHKITALKLQKRNRQRVNVYLDGEFAFGLARIVAAWLQVGLELSDEKIAQLKSEDAREVAYQRALKFLEYRPRTEEEIRRNLKKHDVPEEIIAATVERLQRANLINDLRFAKNWVENRSDRRPRGRRALAFELRQKGVNRQAIDRALEDVDEERLAYRAALKQSRKLIKLEQQEFRRKLYGYLSRRGFSYEVSAPVVSQVWEQIHENETMQEDFSEEVDK
jgi:regulatory protein